MSHSFKFDLQTRFGRIRGEFPLADEPISLAEFAFQILSFDERLIDIAAKSALEEGAGKISCKPNCGACCRQAVPVSIPEAFLLRDLMRSMPEDRSKVVLKRIDAIKDSLVSNNIDAELRPGETADDRWSRLSLRYFALGLACPFLENESCSIYENRPTICREFLVTSPVEACSDPELEFVRGIDNVFILSHCLARLAGILMDGEPNIIPLTHALEWAEKNLEWDSKRFDASMLYATLFDILRDFVEEG